MAEDPRITYVLIDGENIDATLGTSILGRRPRPEERPRWERVLQFAQELWRQPAAGLFFLAANNELPMPFVQALMAIGYRPVPLSGAAGEKVVDIAIQRTLSEIRRRRRTCSWSAMTGTSSTRWATSSTAGGWPSSGFKSSGAMRSWS